MSIIKILLLINLALILISLFSGVFFLSRDDADKTRVVTSLTIRVILSFSLIALLMIGYFSGLIQPHAL